MSDEPPSAGPPGIDDRVDIRIDPRPLSEAERHWPDVEDLERMLRIAVGHALAIRECHAAEIDFWVTDDASIRAVNADRLGHDYATDSICFGRPDAAGRVEGSAVISHETAAREAIEHDVAPEVELCLYAVHATLHMTGMDDADEEDRRGMRRSEIECLRRMGWSGLSLGDEYARAATASGAVEVDG